MKQLILSEWLLTELAQGDFPERMPTHRRVYEAIRRAITSRVLSSGARAAAGRTRRQSARVGVSQRGGPDAQVDAVPTEHRSRSDDLCAKLRILPTAGTACTHFAACVAPNTRRHTSLSRSEDGGRARGA